MTTTKEEQIRAEFETCYLTKWVSADRIEFVSGSYVDADINARWEAYKACAESYEQKLAYTMEVSERGAIVLSAQVAGLERKLSEANKKLADMVVHHNYEMSGCAMRARHAEEKLDEANARNARLVEALELVNTCSCAMCSDCTSVVHSAILANSETVAEYEREVTTAAKVKLLNWLYECGYLTEEAAKLHQAEQLRAANSEAVASSSSDVSDSDFIAGMRAVAGDEDSCWK